MGSIRFPRALTYLETLPGGIAAHPECRTTADYSIMIREEFPQLARDPDLPLTVRQALRAPWREGEWMSEVAANTLVLLVRDRIHQDDIAFAEWTFEFSRQLFKRPMYRLLMHVLSPHLVLMGAAHRWEKFHIGSHLKSSGVKSSAKLRLTYPPNLFATTNLLSLSAAYQAAAACAGAKNVQGSAREVSPGEAAFEIRWA